MEGVGAGWRACCNGKHLALGVARGEVLNAS